MGTDAAVAGARRGVGRVYSRYALLVAMIAASGAHAEAQEPPSYQTLRYEEDHSYLHDPALRQETLDRFRYLPLTEDGAAYLSLGGEARERYEYTENPTFGQDPQDEYGVFLQRYVLHGDLHLGSHVRVFGQLYSALENGRKGGPSPVDQDELTVQNAFVDFRFNPTQDSIATLRGGRQELEYGSGRLVSVREGPNVRRTFDGARAILELSEWRIDGLYARPRLDQPGVFDDETNDEQALWGVYAAGAPDFWLAGGVDLYYLGFEADNAVFDQGTADETRHSLGFRVWGAEGPWDWNWEALYQFGRFGVGDISAWTAATDTGYTVREAPWTPRFAINANIASGDDDPTDADLGTFNALFPRGSYFSEAAVLGPRNFFNVHPFVTVNPTDGWSLTTDVNFFWRLDTDDGVYSPSGRLIRSGAGSDKRFVGSAVSLTSGWQFGRHLTLTALYTHFFPGAFIKETGPAEDIDFFELTARFRF